MGSTLVRPLYVDLTLSSVLSETHPHHKYLCFESIPLSLLVTDYCASEVFCFNTYAITITIITALKSHKNDENVGEQPPNNVSGAEDNHVGDIKVPVI